MYYKFILKFKLYVKFKLFSYENNLIFKIYFRAISFTKSNTNYIKYLTNNDVIKEVFK